MIFRFFCGVFPPNSTMPPHQPAPGWDWLPEVETARDVTDHHLRLAYGLDLPVCDEAAHKRWVAAAGLRHAGGLLPC